MKKVAMKDGKILIADDEATIVRGLSAVLEDEGYAVGIATDGQSALEHLTSEVYGVMLLDLKMPKIDGIALLKEMQTREISTECIIVTGQATVDSAIQAMRHGAYDYIEKPLGTDKLTRLKALIPKAFDKFNVKQANRVLTSRLEELTHFGELTGQSEEMRDIYRIIEAVAPSTASVLILGESGTGKELVARALHSKSERAKGPFLALNCAALPKDILENELFGHEKGAFTGSTNEKPGAFEMADGGTIFLDEVAEMATDIQVKLLRALESRTIRRLGGKKEIAVDIRIVAATNKDLQKALADQDLREDLYYRLSVVDIFLPPLRERVGDIRLLAHEFLSRFSHENGKAFTTFDDSAWAWILGYHWPGNVRELKNAVERAVIMSRGTTIGVDDVMPRHLRSSGEIPAVVTVPVGSTLADARRQLALRTFASTAGDLDRAAKILGMSSSELRAELLPLVSSNGRANEHVPTVSEAPPRKAKPKAPAAKSSRKVKTKGRR
ncbi:MAG: sigma-54-dependent Fis family transcriptional regulator [Anaerolineae bacterium]|nr:sigma-54-dependent Fis family transcriptional regulator [Gemmatimonadaceae bacterium]